MISGTLREIFQAEGGEQGKQRVTTESMALVLTEPSDPAVDAEEVARLAA